MAPILWLIIVNDLLVKCKNKDFEIVAYADELIILLNASASFHFNDLTIEPLGLIDE